MKLLLLILSAICIPVLCLSQPGSKIASDPGKSTFTSVMEFGAKGDGITNDTNPPKRGRLSDH